MLGYVHSNSSRSMAGPRRARRASTMIELLVVISIIGLLITMLLPSLRRSMDLASTTVCQYNLRELGHCLTLYRIENHGWLPTVAQTDENVAARSQISQNEAWFVKMFPTYLQDPQILTCPEDPFAFRLLNDRSRLRNPEVADYPSYGINNFIMSAGSGFLANVDRYQPTRPLDTILVADLGPDNVGRRRRSSNTLVGPSRNSSLMTWGDGFDPFTGIPAHSWLTTRHNHGINILTLAGGIRSIKTVDMLRAPIRKRYAECAAGGCTLCNELGLYHYSFAKEHLYWWTGPAPVE